MTTTNLRRYYLSKALFAGPGLAGTWRAKQHAVPGTPLSAEFPARARLIASGYSCVEDVTGAEACELVTYAGLSEREARAAVAAAGAAP